MKVVPYSLLLGISFAIKCRLQFPSVHWEQDKGLIKKFDLNGLGANINWPCGGLFTNLYSCSSTKLESSYTKPVFDWGGTWAMAETTGTAWSDTKKCLLSAVCEKLAGGVDGCRFAEYEYTKWRPTSCDRTNDFDAVTTTFQSKISLSCCSNPDFCNQNEDFGDCTVDEAFGDYLEDLNVCWNDVKKDFMSKLLCDADGNRLGWNALGWSNNCTEENGEWKVAARTNPDCRYRPRCTKNLTKALKTFGECSCKAATDNEQTGAFIATAMETNWQRFCPNIELSCAADGVVELLYKYWLIRYRIRVALARAAITDAILDAIKEKAAEILNLYAEDLKIVIEPADNSSTRRLLADEVEISITSTVEDEKTSTYIKGKMNDALAAEIGAAIGADTTKEDVTVEEDGDTTEGSYTVDEEEEEEGPDKATAVYTFGVWCVVAMVVLFQM